VTAIALTLTPLATAEPRPAPAISAKIQKARANTHRCETLLGLEPTPVSTTPVRGPLYSRWVLTLWQGRAQAACRLAHELGYPAAAIRAVFGSYADQALAVARCESGHSMTPRAHNGQYLGMFQMGDHARSQYGHGDTPLEQARAAHAYFVASGRDWSPWSCKPYSGVQ
jgi:hypothetical protein